MNSKESLNNIKNLFIGSPINPTQQFEIIEKDLEVLEIIKKKEVVIGLLKGILHSDLHTHTASYYNSHFIANYRHLTQEEFNKLKEWLSNE